MQYYHVSSIFQLFLFQHFVGENGPTAEFPDPLPADPLTAKKKPSRKRKSPRKRENNVSKPKFAKLSAAKALLSLYESAASTSDNSIENNVIDEDHSATCAGNLENNTFVEEPILSTSTSDKLLENNVIVEDHSATRTCNNLLENNASVEEPISSTCVPSCPEEQYRADEQNNRGKEKVSESNENNQSPRKWTTKDKKRFRRESL